MASSGTLLNLLWISLCLGAILVQLRRMRQRPESVRARIRGGLAVFLTVVALFPTVSNSDDTARIEFLQASAQTKPHDGGMADKSQDKSLGTLVRLFEILESAQVTACLTLVTTLFFFAQIRALRPRSTDRLTPATAGRGPPSFLFNL
ncbi:MAG: hypothetical protein ABI823_00495 [Bryobacteraceae bacterium]